MPMPQIDALRVANETFSRPATIKLSGPARYSAADELRRFPRGPLGPLVRPDGGKAARRHIANRRRRCAMRTLPGCWGSFVTLTYGGPITAAYP